MSAIIWRAAAGSCPYLRFWFNVLYSDLPLIDAGQGDAVLERLRPRWQTHVASVFEDGARSHAQRLVAAGALPSTLAIGRWWSSSGPSVEVDVLGLDGNAMRLLGEVKWTTGPLTVRELATLQAKVDHVPNPVSNPILALWGRDGVDDSVRAAGALGFDSQDMVAASSPAQRS